MRGPYKVRFNGGADAPVLVDVDADEMASDGAGVIAFYKDDVIVHFVSVFNMLDIRGEPGDPDSAVKRKAERAEAEAKAAQPDPEAEPADYQEPEPRRPGTYL